MNLKNISTSKIIGVGEITILPGETKEIPKEFESSPCLEVYEGIGIAVIERGDTQHIVSESEGVEPQSEEETDEAETLRKARLASLRGIGEEELGTLARELGINPADCKDRADVLKHVRAALKK